MVFHQVPLVDPNPHCDDDYHDLDNSDKDDDLNHFIPTIQRINNNDNTTINTTKKRTTITTRTTKCNNNGMIWILSILICLVTNSMGFVPHPTTKPSTTSSFLFKRNNNNNKSNKNIYDNTILLRSMTSSSLSSSSSSSFSDSSSKATSKSNSSTRLNSTTTDTDTSADTSAAAAAAIIMNHNQKQYNNDNNIDDTYNTIAKADAAVTTTTADNNGYGPMSLSFSNLIQVLGGGIGRARTAWDCYRMGIDPLVLFSDEILSSSESSTSSTSTSSTNISDNDFYLDEYGLMTTTYSSSKSSLSKSLLLLQHPQRKTFSRHDLLQLITPKRRQYTLGRTARTAMKELLLPPKHHQPSNDNNNINHDDNSSSLFLPFVGIETTVAKLNHVSQSSDGTTKLLIQLLRTKDDNNNIGGGGGGGGFLPQVEAVIIPWENTKRSTLCISSQVGCRQGCTFCATGRMGLLRNLTTDEILAQVYYSKKICRILDIYPVDGIVFMGMGEPADNAQAVVQAAKVLTDKEQFGMAQTKVTISTVGPTPTAFADLAKANVALAWSVHAVNDKLRKQIVPTTKYTMKELRNGYLHALTNNNNNKNNNNNNETVRNKKLQTSMLEVILIDHVNDFIENANDLADFVLEMKQTNTQSPTLLPSSTTSMEANNNEDEATSTSTTMTETKSEHAVNVVAVVDDDDDNGNISGGGNSGGSIGDIVVHKHLKIMVNLIPFNDIGHPTFRKPSMERIWEFQNHLISRGITCKIRTTRGDEESAACGQLATSKSAKQQQAQMKKEQQQQQEE